MKKTFHICIVFVLLFIFSLGIFAFDVNEAFDSGVFECEAATLPYRIYVPDDYNPSSKYPLVVFLHGAGERGDDNTLQLRNTLQTLFTREDGLMMESIVIAPQCPKENQWVDTPWGDGNYSSADVPESNELSAVVLLIQAISSEYSIDKARVYAMGVSMGGFGTWDLLIRHNDLIAAGAPICGAGDPSAAGVLVKTPIYTFHGALDNDVPIEGTKEMISAIEDEGGRLANIIVYDRDYHNIWEKAAAEPDWLSFIFEQKLTDRYPDLIVENTETTAPDTEAPETDSKTDTEAQASTSDTYTENTPSENQDSPKKLSNLSIAIIAVVLTIGTISGVAFAILYKKK